jgi:hypothetical protein
MRGQARTAERRIARIASRQHGVVTRRQLLDAGITKGGIERRLDKGLLIARYPGVYRVGHAAESIEAEYMAAVLACGHEAVLSDRAAGHLLKLLKRPPSQPQVIARTERRIDGIATRRCRRLDPRDVSVFRAIPVTTVPRTLVDLAAELSEDDLARACHEAGVLYRTTPRQVDAVLERRPNAPGAGKLRRVMRGDVHVTLSKLERAFLALLRKEGLPLPVTNRPAGSKRVDCRWPEHGLTVELDSYQFHNSRYSWEQAHRRRREAHARGEEFRPYTWADVVEDPRYLLAELRELLRTAGG